MDGLNNLKKISVNELSHENCMDLFYYYYHNRHDDDSLQNILLLTDRHTVTVELLAKIADTEEMLLTDFLQSLIECGFSLSEEEAASAHAKLRNEARIIEQLQKLFYFYGCTYPEKQLLIKISTIPSLPFDFFKAKTWFDLKNRTDLNRLAKKGWLKKNAQYINEKCRYNYSIHSVIASAIRAQFIDILYPTCHDLIIILTKEMKKIRAENVSIKKELIQFSWSINDIFKNDFCGELDATFLWTLADIYSDIGYFNRAISILCQLLEIYSSLYGIDCDPAASVHNSLGLIYYEKSQFKASLDEYKYCRKICMSSYDSSSASSKEKIDLGSLDLNIGKTYLRIDYSKAKPYLENAYRIFTNELGKTSYNTLNTYAHLGSFMERDGDMKGAEEIFLNIYNSTDKNSSSLEERMLHAGVAHYLGSLYSETSTKMALPYLEEAKSIQISSLSPTHPDTLDTLNSIANCHLVISDNPTAVLNEFYDLLYLMIKVYGDSDPNVASVYNNIGLCHYYLGQTEEALDNYLIALKIYDSIYLPDHEHSAYIYNNIGNVLVEDNRIQDAIFQHEHALKIYQNSYETPYHMDVAQTNFDLSDAFLRIGNIEAAYTHLKSVFEIYDYINLTKDSLKYASAYSILSNILIAQNNIADAKICLNQTMQILITNDFSEDSNAVKEITNRIITLSEE